MAQDALTVTPPNPTPPTNLSFVGNTPPLDPAQAYVDDGIPTAVPNSRSVAASNDATINAPAGVLTVFAAKTAAANTAGAPGAGVSYDHEGLSPAPTVITAPGSVSTAPTAWIILNPPAYSSNPNNAHASSLSAAVTPTVSAASGASNVSGVGTTLLTVTGTLFNRSSVVYVSGIPQNTQYVSATSLTVAKATKKGTSGTLPVFVANGGGTSTTINWTFT